MPIGLFGPERLQFASGGPAVETQVYVFLPTTNVKAVLFADPDALTTASNPLWTDQYGELSFFAEMGNYDLVVNGARIPITIDTAAPSGGITESDVDRMTHWTHTQTLPEKDWVIDHPLGKPISGYLVQENTGDWVVAALAENTPTRVVLSFNAPTAGKAELGR